MTAAETVRLADLRPRWWAEAPDRWGMGISFLCPHCKTTRLAVAFENPIDGGARADASTTFWQRAGDSFDTLTVRPSIDTLKIGHWKGFITTGIVHP